MKAWLDAVHASPDVPFIIADPTLRCVRPAMIGTPLDIEITTSQARVWRDGILDPRDDGPVADGQTVQVMYDYDARRSVEIPVDVRAGLARV